MKKSFSKGINAIFVIYNSLCVYNIMFKSHRNIYKCIAIHHE